MRRRLMSLLFALSIAAPASATPADYLVNNRAGNPAGFTDYQPQACLVRLYDLGMGAQESIVLIWRTQSAAGQVGYQAAIAGIPMLSLGALPAPAGWTWYYDVQLRASAGDATGGTVCICGMLRNTTTPRVYAVGTLRGRMTSPASIAWDPPQVIHTPAPDASGILYIGELAMDSFRESNRVTLLHPSNFFASGPRYWMRQSEDGGATWGPPVSVENDSTHSGNCAVQYGAMASKLWVVWSRMLGEEKSIQSREVLPDGSGFLPIETSSPGPNVNAFGPHGDFSALNLATAANPDSASSAAHSLIVGTGFGVLPSQASFPAVGVSPSVNEVEPNGSAATALAIPVPGPVLRGMVSTGAPADTDWYSLPLVAGQYVPAWFDSMRAGSFLEMSWIGPDGISKLAGSYSFAPEPVGFVAPVSGTYYLRVVVVSGPSPAEYRVRTMASVPPVSGTRDQCDLFTWQRSSGAWQSPVNLSESVAPKGTPESGLALCGNMDGYLYASWYDWSSTPGTDQVRRMMARSLDGVYWSSPVVVSAAVSDWAHAQLSTDARPNGLGLHNMIATDGWNMVVPWTDTRNGDPDVYVAVINHWLSLQLNPLPSTDVLPGQQVAFTGTVTSYDAYFPWFFGNDASAVDRNWPAQPPGGGQMSPGGNAALYSTLAVPDTASPGLVTIRVRLYSGFAPANTMTWGMMTLNVLSAAAVSEAGPRLELAPPSPNPARASAQVNWSLARAGQARLEVFGVDGRLVRTLASGALAAGPHLTVWSGDDDAGHSVPSGVYFVRLRAEGRDLVRRLVRMD